MDACILVHLDLLGTSLLLVGDIFSITYVQLTGSSANCVREPALTHHGDTLESTPVTNYT